VSIERREHLALFFVLTNEIERLPSRARFTLKPYCHHYSEVSQSALYLVDVMHQLALKESPKSWILAPTKLISICLLAPNNVVFVSCSQSGSDPWEILAKFGYKLNMKEIFLNVLLHFVLPT
jgi:hypothetical protein